MAGEEVHLKPDALAHLADALTEDIVATPSHQLALEEIADARQSRELVLRFDDILAEASTAAGERPATATVTESCSATWNLANALCEDIATHPDEMVEAEVLNDRDAHSLAGAFDDIVRRDPHLAAAGLVLPPRAGSRLPPPARHAKAALAKLLDRLVLTAPGRAMAGSFATAVVAAVLTVIVYDHEPRRPSLDPMPVTASDQLTSGGGTRAVSAASAGREERTGRSAAAETAEDVPPENLHSPPPVRTDAARPPVAVPDRQPENEPPPRGGGPEHVATAMPDIPAAGTGAPTPPPVLAKRDNDGPATRSAFRRAVPPPSSVTGPPAVMTAPPPTAPPPASRAVTPDGPAAAVSELAAKPPPASSPPLRREGARDGAGTAVALRLRPEADAACSGPATPFLSSWCAAPLTAAQERSLQPRDSFRECADCPEMVFVPAGSFTMGSPEQRNDRSRDQGLPHVVTIGRPFAIDVLHVTVGQFAEFARETGYAAHSDCSWRDPGFVQEDSYPVVCVSFDDAAAYADWLTKKTGRQYRLLSEAEWEYVVVRDPRLASGLDLSDMSGNALQWTADCWHDSYAGAPADGSAWTTACQGSGHVVVSNARNPVPGRPSAASRTSAQDARNDIGFRVARTLGP